MFSIFSLLLPYDIRLSILIASGALYTEMILEKSHQILNSKLVLILKVIAGIFIALDAAIWIFQFFAFSIENFGLGIISALITFTLITPLIYNPFRKKRWQSLLYWTALSVEIGLLFETLLPNQSPFIGIISGSISMLIFLILFELRRVIEFLREIGNYIKYFITQLIHNFKIIFEKIRSFVIDHKNAINIIAVIILDIILCILIWFMPLNAFQTISIGTAFSSIFLFPVFSSKEKSKTQKTFSRMVYYSLMVYTLFSVVIYAFAFIIISTILEFFIWMLLSIIFFSAILLVVIYRRERIYDLSIRWRFSFLILTILMVILLCILLVLNFL
jgi:hypothetical protein